MSPDVTATVTAVPATVYSQAEFKEMDSVSVSSDDSNVVEVSTDNVEPRNLKGSFIAPIKPEPFSEGGCCSKSKIMLAIAALVVGVVMTSTGFGVALACAVGCKAILSAMGFTMLTGLSTQAAVAIAGAVTVAGMGIIFISAKCLETKPEAPKGLSYDMGYALGYLAAQRKAQLIEDQRRLREDLYPTSSFGFTKDTKGAEDRISNALENRAKTRGSAVCQPPSSEVIDASLNSEGADMHGVFDTHEADDKSSADDAAPAAAEPAVASAAEPAPAPAAEPASVPAAESAPAPAAEPAATAPAAPAEAGQPT